MDASTTASATVSAITTASVVVPVGIEYLRIFCAISTFSRGGWG